MTFIEVPIIDKFISKPSDSRQIGLINHFTKIGEYKAIFRTSISETFYEINEVDFIPLKKFIRPDLNMSEDKNVAVYIYGKESELFSYPYNGRVFYSIINNSCNTELTFSYKKLVNNISYEKYMPYLQNLSSDQLIGYIDPELTDLKKLNSCYPEISNLTSNSNPVILEFKWSE